VSIDRATLMEAARVCGCFNLRRAARAVTRLYDEALDKGGLRSTGFVALAMIEAEGEVTLPRLATLLGVDRSTLTRNLNPLRRQGLVELRQSASSRMSTARLTRSGRATLRRCVPLWQAAQVRFEERVGSPQWTQILRGLDAIAKAGSKE
jgi:DNA-binding MarR family transcriptional regulator